MMRAQTNIQTAVNRPLRERLGSLIPGQSLAGGVRDRYRTPATAYTRATSLFIRCASRRPVYPPLTRPRLSYCASRNRVVGSRLADRCDGIAHFVRQEGRSYRWRRVQSTAALFVAGGRATSCARNVSGYWRSLSNLYHAANAERTDTIACSREAAERAPRSEVSNARRRSGP